MKSDLNEIKNKTISGVFWRLGERVLAQLISFIVSIVLARILMPEEYGIVALIMVFINVLNAFVVNGLGTSLVQKKDSDAVDFSTMFYGSIILSLVLYALLFVMSPIIAGWYSNVQLIVILRVMGIRLPIAAINSIQQAYVSKKMEYRKFFYSTLVGTLISGIFGIVAAKMGFGVWALVIQYLSNCLMDTIVLFITVEWKPILAFSFNRFKSLFKYGYKVMLTGVIGTFFDQLKNFVIGVKYTSEDLAYYNRGEQIPSLAYNNVSSALESVLFPALSQVQDDKDVTKRALRRIISLICFIIMPIMFGLAAVAEPLVLVLLTSKWLPCVKFLMIVSIQQVFAIINNVHLQAIKALGRSDILLKLEFIKKPIFILFIIFGMQYGPLAIVLANFIYGFIALFIDALQNRKLLCYSFKEQLNDILPSLVNAILMFIVCFFVGLIPLSPYLILLLQIIVGVIIYVILSKIFKVDSFYLVKDYVLKLFKSVIKKLISKFFGLSVFKVNNKKIVFDNFNGKGYGCNPKYIAEEIIREKLNYDLVWLVNDMNEEMPDEIRKVKKSSLKAYYELATAKIWVDNVRNYKGVSKKQKQFYIQTWHGALGIKAVEKDAIETLSQDYVIEAINDGKISDLILTNNKWHENYIRKYFWYSGKIYSNGTPRCDIIFNTPEDIKMKVYDYFKIDRDKKIVLYAPTFRNNDDMSIYKFDYERSLISLKEKFSNEYVMLIRLHPNVSRYCNEFNYNDKVLSATSYSDIQELIAASDIIITDYSSVSFEASLAYKPVFLLAKDFDEYIKNDRKLVFSFDEIPFDLAKDEEKLYRNIEKFNISKYKSKCKYFHDSIGLSNNSESSKDIVGIIKNVIGKDYE